MSLAYFLKKRIYLDLSKLFENNVAIEELS